MDKTDSQGACTHDETEDGLRGILSKATMVNRSLANLKPLLFSAPKTFASVVIASCAAFASVALILGTWEALTSSIVQIILGYPQVVAGLLFSILSMTPMMAALRGGARMGRLGRVLNALFGLALVGCGCWFFTL